MKRLMTLIIMLTIILSAVSYGAEELLTLSEVSARMLKFNKELNLDNASTSIAKKIYDTAVKDAGNIDISYEEYSLWFITDPDAAAITEKRKEKELTPKEKKLDYDYSVKYKTVHENLLKVETMNAYYGLIKTDKEIAYKKAYNEYLKSKLQDSKQKYIRGLMSKNDYTLEKLDQRDAESEVMISQRNRTQYIIKLYSLMGEGYQPDIQKLEENLQYQAIDTDVDTMVLSAFANNVKVFNAEGKVNLKEIGLEIAERYYEEDDWEYLEAQNDLQEAKVNLLNEKNNIEYEVRTTYNDVQNLFDTIEINKREVMKKEISYKVAKLKYMLKMITNTQLEESRLNLESVKLNLNNSIMDYLSSNEKLTMLQGSGLE